MSGLLLSLLALFNLLEFFLVYDFTFHRSIIWCPFYKSVSAENKFRHF
jgi:hypothetical protein